MPDYIYRFHDEARTKPMTCACCGYPAPVELFVVATWNDPGKYLCQLCVEAKLDPRLDRKLGWITNHILDAIHHGPGDQK